MKREVRLKLEFRDVLAVLSLGVVVLALELEAHGHPTPEWLRTPVGTVLTVVLGFYFVDKVRRAGEGASAAPPAPGSE